MQTSDIPHNDLFMADMLMAKLIIFAIPKRMSKCISYASLIRIKFDKRAISSVYCSISVGL